MKFKFFFLFILFISCLAAEAQKLKYVGIGYNLSYTRLRGLNNFVDAYNVDPNKSGGFLLGDSLDHFHLLKGMNFAVGIELEGGNILEIRYTRRKGVASASGTGPTTFTRELVFTMPTFGVGLTTPAKNLGPLDYAFGGSFDLNFGNIKTKLVENGVSSDYLKLKSYFSFAATPFVQFYAYPLGRGSRFMLGVKPYYQMNLWGRNFMPVNTEIPNVFDGRKLKSTASNVGVEINACIKIGRIEKRPKKIKSIIVKEEPVIEEPIRKPVKDEITSGFVIKGKVLSKKDNTPVSGAKVEITDANGTVLGNAISENDGSYKVQLKEGTNFNITAQNKGYLTNHESAELGAESSSVEKDVLLVPIEVGTSVNLKNVLFEKGTSNLTEDSYPELDRLVQFMNENPTVTIEIGGHTSNEGDPKLNTKLSADRVKIVKDYLVKKGISSSRIDVKAYGPTKPLYQNDTEEHKRMNRRVEFTILKN